MAPVPGATGAAAPGTVASATTTGTTPGTAAQLQGAAAAAAPVPAQSQDVVVPVWVALLVGLLAVGAYGAAGWNHLRLRAMSDRKSG